MRATAVGRLRTRELGPVTAKGGQFRLRVARAGDKAYLFFTLERVLVRVLRNPLADVLECVLACLLALGVGSSSVDVRGVEALEGGPEEVHELVLPAF